VVISKHVLEKTVDLRNHPKMSHGGVRSWPPSWTWIGGEEKEKKLYGEMGVLLDVTKSATEKTAPMFHLIMEHEAATYIGTLMFDDASFCDEIHNLLLGCGRRPIKDIGSIDISHVS
jgi:hypothetical protein